MFFSSGGACGGGLHVGGGLVLVPSMVAVFF